MIEVKPSGLVVTAKRLPNPDDFQEGDMWTHDIFTKWFPIKFRLSRMLGFPITHHSAKILHNGEWVGPVHINLDGKTTIGGSL